MPMEVVDVGSMSRYELLEDGGLLGYLSYEEQPGSPDGDGGGGPTVVRDLQHTVIDAEHRGRGLGGTLVSAALDDIRGRGMRLVPTCWFIRDWVDAHPDQQDLVA